MTVLYGRTVWFKVVISKCFVESLLCFIIYWIEELWKNIPNLKGKSCCVWTLKVSFSPSLIRRMYHIVLKIKTLSDTESSKGILHTQKNSKIHQPNKHNPEYSKKIQVSLNSRIYLPSISYKLGRKVRGKYNKSQFTDKRNSQPTIKFEEAFHYQVYPKRRKAWELLIRFTMENSRFNMM